MRAELLRDRRMLKFRDVLSRWERRELSQLEAAEVLGISERQFRRWRDRYEDHGESGLRDHRLGKAPATTIPGSEVTRLRRLYQTTYKGWNVKHFHEHGVRYHQFRWGYTWTKTRLQAGAW